LKPFFAFDTLLGGDDFFGKMKEKTMANRGRAQEKAKEGLR
jgi:hypothetical protein